MPSYPDPSNLDGVIEYSLAPLSIYRSPRNDYVNRVSSSVGSLIMEWDGKHIEAPASCESYSLTPERWYFELTCCRGALKLSLFRTWKQSTRWVSDMQVWTFAPGYKFGIPHFGKVIADELQERGYGWDYYLLDNVALHSYLLDQLSGHTLSEFWEWFIDYIDPDNVAEGWNIIPCPSGCPIEGTADDYFVNNPREVYNGTWDYLKDGLATLGFKFTNYNTLSLPPDKNLTKGAKIAYFLGPDLSRATSIMTIDESCHTDLYIKFRKDCDSYGYINSSVSNCMIFDCSKEEGDKVYPLPTPPGGWGGDYYHTTLRIKAKWEDIPKLYAYMRSHTTHLTNEQFIWNYGDSLEYDVWYTSSGGDGSAPEYTRIVYDDVESYWWGPNPSYTMYKLLTGEDGHTNTNTDGCTLAPGECYQTEVYTYGEFGDYVSITPGPPICVAERPGSNRQDDSGNPLPVDDGDHPQTDNICDMWSLVLTWNYIQLKRTITSGEVTSVSIVIKASMSIESQPVCSIARLSDLDAWLVERVFALRLLAFTFKYKRVGTCICN